MLHTLFPSTSYMSGRGLPSAFLMNSGHRFNFFIFTSFINALGHNLYLSRLNSVLIPLVTVWFLLNETWSLSSTFIFLDVAKSSSNLYIWNSELFLEWEYHVLKRSVFLLSSLICYKWGTYPFHIYEHPLNSWRRANRQYLFLTLHIFLMLLSSLLSNVLCSFPNILRHFRYFYVLKFNKMLVDLVLLRLTHLFNCSSWMSSVLGCDSRQPYIRSNTETLINKIVVHRFLFSYVVFGVIKLGNFSFLKN